MRVRVQVHATPAPGGWDLALRGGQGAARQCGAGCLPALPPARPLLLGARPPASWGPLARPLTASLAPLAAGGRANGRAGVGGGGGVSGEGGGQGL